MWTFGTHWTEGGVRHDVIASEASLRYAPPVQPDDLIFALFQVVTMGPSAFADHVAKTTEMWKERASNLMEKEAALHLQLRPARRRVLQDKKM